MAEILLGYGVDFNLQNNFWKGKKGRREGKGREKKREIGEILLWLWC